MADNSKNLGKYLHKAKPKPEDKSGLGKINTKIVPNKNPSKLPSTGYNGVRG